MSPCAGRFFACSGGWNCLKTSAASLYGPACIVKIVPLRFVRRLVPCSFANTKMLGDMGFPSSRACLYLEFRATATNPAMVEVIS